MSRKIAIAGFGVEGRSAWRYFSSKDIEITILDEKEPADLPEGIGLVVGPNVFENAYGYDLVVRAPSLRPDRIKTDGIITSATKEFFDKCPAPIIGVTGSKGKGTTCSLIHHIIKASGKTSYLVGNIGVAALDVLEKVKPEDVVVFELSSFQLWDLEKSPNAAAVLLIEPEHLDVHKDADEYVRAKSNIRRYQTSDDICYYHPTNIYAKYIADQSEHKDGAFRYAIEDDGAVYVKDGWFYSRENRICEVDELKITGDHNIENACAAISLALNFIEDRSAVAKGLRSFYGLPHRLRFVKEVDGVKFYDDSIATIPIASIAAIRSFEQPKVIILGGSDKGADFASLAKEIVDSNIRHVVLIGLLRDKLRDSLENAGYSFDKMTILDQETSMEEIVNVASSEAEFGDVVLLSPACASFDMFKSYVDRGDQFIEAVEKL